MRAALPAATEVASDHGDRWRRRAGAVSFVRERRAPQPIRVPAAPETVEIDFSRTALVVIDMQNDFCHPDGWFAAVRNVDSVPLVAPLANIKGLAHAFRAAGAPVLLVNWGVRPDRADLPANVLDKARGCGRWAGYGAPQERAHGRILATREWGVAPIAGRDVEPSDLIVAKTRLSGFKDTALDQILRRRDVTTVVYTGINIDRCVFATLMGGAFAGYDPILVEDATATPSPDFVRDAVLLLVRQLYGSTTRTDDLLTAIRQLPEEGSS